MKVAIALAIAFALGMIAGAWMVGAASADHLTNCEDRPPTSRYDINGDGVLNSRDHQCLAAAQVQGVHEGTPTWTPEATSTASPLPSSQPFSPSPTAAAPSSTPTLEPLATIPPSASATPTSSLTTTATPSPIPTATNTPTATATATGNSVAAILADSRDNHDGVICGVGGYSWEFGGDIHAVGNGGYPTGTGWWVFQWDCGFQRSGVRVEIDTFNAYVLNGSMWRQVTNWTTWCNINNTQTNSNLGPCPLGGNTGPIWDMPNAVQSLHGASDHNSVGTATCALTIVRARLNTSARVMLSAGFDYWSGSSIRGAGVGRYVMLSTSYRYVNFSSCSPTTLAANPPPLS